MKEYFKWLGSIRSIMTFEIITTYCLIVVGLTILGIKKIIDIPVYVAFLGGFTGTVGSIITFYYIGKRREEQNGGGAK